MSPAEKTAKRPARRLTAEARREQLLDVTTDLVVNDGFGAVSIDAVARRAGISRAIVYQHFGDLPALLKAVVAREMARAKAQLSETEVSRLDDGVPSDLLIESLAAYLGAVRDHPATWRLVLMPPEGAPESLRKGIARGRADALAHMTDAVAPALVGDDRSADAELTARMFSAMADEYARLVLTSPRRFTPDRLLAHARWWVEQMAL
ncbi:TetR/AcrR family transcriptional regulator [Conexibacter woesei]|uniref:TetR/AcrR family transcriptional regulator n=1 Tax=Conexibacter woesei TaxID=191495 RepID=UPI000420381A|nr:TetR/AcrR family transcriptional regulator [Conexibacter woesei]